MSKRFSGQSVMLNSGKIIKGKNVRICSPYYFSLLGGYIPRYNNVTLAIVRVDGKEIPVSRFYRRKTWYQGGDGVVYDSHI